jgi:hypothetical protein
MAMIHSVLAAAVASLKNVSALSGVTIVESYDRSKKLDDAAGAVISVSGSSEVMASLANGKHMAWRVNLSVLVATHESLDKSGSLRDGYSAAVFGWMRSLSSLTVTGYNLDGIMEITQGETGESGEKYVSKTNSCTLVLSATT